MGSEFLVDSNTLFYKRHIIFITHLKPSRHIKTTAQPVYHIENGFLAIWPDGMLRMNDDTFGSFGLISESGDMITLAVWRLATNRDTYNIDLSNYIKGSACAEIIYPKESKGVEFVYNKSNRSLSVKVSKNYSARLFKITVKQ
jgi:hypothetical protein